MNEALVQPFVVRICLTCLDKFWYIIRRASVQQRFIQRLPVV